MQKRIKKTMPVYVEDHETLTKIKIKHGLAGKPEAISHVLKKYKV